MIRKWEISKGEIEKIDLKPNGNIKKDKDNLKISSRKKSKDLCFVCTVY